MKRNPDEAYEDFKARRKQENQRVKEHLKGTLIHRSRVFFDDPDGNIQQRSITYRRPENV